MEEREAKRREEESGGRSVCNGKEILREMKNLRRFFRVMEKSEEEFTPLIQKSECPHITAENMRRRETFRRGENESRGVLRKINAKMPEGLHGTAPFTERFSHAFGSDRKTSMRLGEEDAETVGIANIVRFENKRLCCDRPSHGR